MTEEQLERATDAVEAERRKISQEFSTRTAENEVNKRAGNDKPYLSCWPLGREYSRRCAVAALRSVGPTP